MMETSHNDSIDSYSHLSSDLIYTVVNVPGIGCRASDFECQLMGCRCANGLCKTSSCICLSRFGPNYTEDSLLRCEKWDNMSVIECNDACACTSECPNRVVQKGPSVSLEIFEFGGSKGLGLKTRKDLRKGAFICEYAGEVIGFEEARKRYLVASQKDEMNYIFVLRENSASGVLETVVDPTVIGNIGRYINHSCDPNSAIVPVRVDCAVPKLAIFALRGIATGEEITFDYAGGASFQRDSPPVTSISRKPCLCESVNCAKFLPFDKSLC